MLSRFLALPPRLLARFKEFVNPGHKPSPARIKPAHLLDEIAAEIHELRRARRIRRTLTHESEGASARRARNRRIRELARELRQLREELLGDSGLDGLLDDFWTTEVALLGAVDSIPARPSLSILSFARLGGRSTRTRTVRHQQQSSASDGPCSDPPLDPSPRHTAAGSTRRPACLTALHRRCSSEARHA
jgi:hypothetical protein